MTTAIWATPRAPHADCVRQGFQNGLSSSFFGQTFPALWHLVFCVRRKAKQGLNLSRCTHDLVEIYPIDCGVLLDIILEICLGLGSHSIA